MPRYLTDALARRAPLREICSVLALMATLLCARFTLRALQEKCLRPRALVRLHEAALPPLYEKAASVDLAHYDDPRFGDAFVLAAREADERAMKAFDTAVRLFSTLLMTAGYAGAIASLEPYAFLPVALYVAVSLGSSTRAAPASHTIATPRSSRMNGGARARNAYSRSPISPRNCAFPHCRAGIRHAQPSAYGRARSAACPADDACCAWA